jgi:hypothetical protein
LRFTGIEQQNGLGRVKCITTLAKVMDTTLGTDGLVSCVFVFGSFPRPPPEFQKRSASNRNRFWPTATAKEKYKKQIATFRVNTWFRHNVSGIVYSIGYLVSPIEKRLVYGQDPIMW